MKKTLHLIVNAHLDPVWLWDAREGLNEGLATCKAMLDLLDEFPMLKFVRGEAAIYEHIEKYDPAMFERIQIMAATGRWDIVGGNYVQPDHNLPDTASLNWQYRIGQAYFKEKFGKPATAAWAADAFGHSSNLPKILADNGLRYFCFSRPQQHLLTLPSPLFYWQSDNGQQVLGYRIPGGSYQCERFNLIELLNQSLQAAQNSDLTHHGVFAGLGNHGGGSSRRHILEAFAWACKHPQVDFRFSTLTDFFAAAETEKAIPTFCGELNFALRGCHSSALGVKAKFRDAETALNRAMKIAPEADWTTLLKELSFNAFHDILPGSSIDRANREQIEAMAAVIHQARQIEFDALNRKAAAARIALPAPEADQPSTVPFYLYNPRDRVFKGVVELETCIDYRPRFDYRGRADELPVKVMDGKTPLAFQTLPVEHMAFEELPWRKRVIFETEIAPASGKIISIGFGSPPRSAVTPTWRNNASIEVKNGLLYLNHLPFEVATYVDPFGCWGDMSESMEGCCCPVKSETWQIVRHDQICHGDLCREEQIEYHGGRSTLVLNLRRTFDNNDIELKGVIIWQERNVRLRLSVPCGEKITYQNPGGEITRTTDGDVPGGRYLDLHDKRVICNDHFCGFTKIGNTLHINVIRGNLPACNRLDQSDRTRLPADAGKHHFKLIVTDRKERIDDITLEIAAIMTYAHTAPVKPAVKKAKS